MSSNLEDLADLKGDLPPYYNVGGGGAHATPGVSSFVNKTKKSLSLVTIIASSAAVFVALFSVFKNRKPKNQQPAASGNQNTASPNQNPSTAIRP